MDKQTILDLDAGDPGGARCFCQKPAEYTVEGWPEGRHYPLCNEHYQEFLDSEMGRNGKGKPGRWNHPRY